MTKRASCSWILALAAAACGGFSPAPETASGAGGTGGGGSSCAPNETRSCYGGAKDTEGKGICKAGKQTCDASGSWGKCEGEVLPATETCNTDVDDDCDGSINEGGMGCVCKPNDAVSCYTGKSETKDVGKCKSGTQKCNALGTELGKCDGEVLPQTEDCDAKGDEDCDGIPCSDAIFSLAAESNQDSFVGDVAYDSQGNLVITGAFTGTLTLGGKTMSATAQDAFVAKLDPKGAVLWAEQIGGTDDQWITSVAVDKSDDRIYLGGYFYGTFSLGASSLSTSNGKYTVSTGAFLAMLDKNGKSAKIVDQWLLRSGHKRILAVAVSATGNVAAGGYWTGEDQCDVDFCTVSDSRAARLRVFDKFGTVVFQTDSDPPGDQEVNALAFGGPQDNLMVGGRFENKIQLGGASWTTPLTKDVFVGALAINGSGKWLSATTHVPLQANDIALAVSPGGEVALGYSYSFFFGQPKGGAAFGWHVYSASDGTYKTGGSVDGDGYDVLDDLAFDSKARLIILGSTDAEITVDGKKLTPSSSYDPFIAKTGMPFGWAKMFGSANDTRADACAVGPGDRVAMSGYASGALDLGAGAIKAPSGKFANGFVGVFHP
jgi:hypothetical protein